GDQALAQVPGRERSQRPAQAAAGAPVVGHRHDGRDLARVAAGGSQGGGQPVAATQGDHPGLADQRSTSRWCTLGLKPRASISRATSSAITTERCWPPVQPTATVRYDL